MSKLYDENSKQSILEYAQQLEGKTLRDVLSNNIIVNMPTDDLGNKGRYGHKSLPGAWPHLIQNFL